MTHRNHKPASAAVGMYAHAGSFAHAGPITYGGIPNDPILPAQWNGMQRSMHRSGEHMLCLAVLELAIADLSHHFEAIRRDARRWLMSSTQRAYGCEWICSILGMNPSAIREALRKRPAVTVRFSHSARGQISHNVMGVLRRGRRGELEKARPR